MEHFLPENVPLRDLLNAKPYSMKSILLILSKIAHFIPFLTHLWKEFFDKWISSPFQFKWWIGYYVIILKTLVLDFGKLSSRKIKTRGWFWITLLSTYRYIDHYRNDFENCLLLWYSHQSWLRLADQPIGGPSSSEGKIM